MYVHVHVDPTPLVQYQLTAMDVPALTPPGNPPELPANAQPPMALYTATGPAQPVHSEGECGITRCVHAPA